MAIEWVEAILMMTKNEKMCSRCKEIKNRGEFSKDRNGKNGLSSQCSRCHSISAKKRYDKIRKRKIVDIEINTNKNKRCSKCKKVKDLNYFYSSAISKTGRQSSCIDCMKEYDKTRKPSFERYYGQYVCSSRKRKMKLNLTLEQFSKFWQKPCHYCGVEIKTVGLDRINNKLGYNIDNCVPCCKKCNYMKTNLTSYDFLKHIDKIHLHNKVSNYDKKMYEEYMQCAL